MMRQSRIRISQYGKALRLKYQLMTLEMRLIFLCFVFCFLFSCRRAVTGKRVVCKFMQKMYDGQIFPTNFCSSMHSILSNLASHSFQPCITFYIHRPTNIRSSATVIHSSPTSLYSSHGEYSLRCRAVEKRIHFCYFAGVMSEKMPIFVC